MHCSLTYCVVTWHGFHRSIAGTLFGEAVQEGKAEGASVLLICGVALG